MPFPYNIIFGRDTALPCPLYHSDATGFDIIYVLTAEKVAITIEIKSGSIGINITQSKDTAVPFPYNIILG